MVLIREGKTNMSSTVEDRSIYVVLALSLALAIRSAPADPGEITGKFQWLLAAGATIEAQAEAGAIGGDPEALQGP